VKEGGGRGCFGIHGRVHLISDHPSLPPHLLINGLSPSQLNKHRTWEF